MAITAKLRNLVMFILFAALLNTAQSILPPPPAPPAAFGMTNASVAGSTLLANSLNVSSIDSGTSQAPKSVQQAYLASVNGSSVAGGTQTV